MRSIMPLLLTDSYKTCHWRLYPKNLEYVYSNTTARKSRVEGLDQVVVFGVQYFVKEYLINQFNELFFNVPIADVLAEYHSVIDDHVGPQNVSEKDITYLHSLGYLPVRIKALPEGSICDIKVPFTTIINTDPKCGWITNYLETISQTVIWQAVTSATIAKMYKDMLLAYANKTGGDVGFVNWQGHDFSMRGMSSIESACVSSSGHLTSFTGSDTVPAIKFIKEYYPSPGEFISGSVCASEHSIQCSYFVEGKDDEDDYIQAMLDAQPTGIVSIVCDGYDYWRFITENLINFKAQILARNGKVVVRPDTGCPVRITAGYIVANSKYNSTDFLAAMSRGPSHMKAWSGDHDAIKTTDGKYYDINSNELTETEVKGSIQVLYEIFGGTVNAAGYIDLNPHIGLIYGDSITYDRAKKICDILAAKGFSSTNVVFGIGSYTYQYNTRDTFGMACKATWVRTTDGPKNIFKSPKTGDGMKKSAKGLLHVSGTNGHYKLKDQCSPEEEATGALETVFENGKMIKSYSLREIRDRINEVTLCLEES